MVSHARRSTRDSEGMKIQIASTRIRKKTNMVKDFMEPLRLTARLRPAARRMSDSGLRLNRGLACSRRLDHWVNSNIFLLSLSSQVNEPNQKKNETGRETNLSGVHKLHARGALFAIQPQ